MLVGSCFTEHIGARLTDLRFNTLINPFGIVYNPMSMATALERLLDEKKQFSPEDLFENQGLWRSWDHHGHFAKPDRGQALESINTAFITASRHFAQTSRLLLTLGTAEGHYLLEQNRVVANNHKMPARLFESKRLSVEEVTAVLSACFQKLLVQHPQLQVVLSVSPVRHLRNGMVENQRSKAVLLLACEALCRQFPQVHYFPAYEILLDDLRDYRFYTADMLHPSEVAVDYIWSYFSDMFFSEETRRLNVELGKIATALRHRPFNPESEQHQAFVAAQKAALRQLGFNPDAP